MRFIPPQLHKVLDFVTIVLFALAPSLLPLAGLAADLSYGLAAVHLLVTLVTGFPGRAKRLLPLQAHGAIELVVGVALIALPFIAGWADRSRLFYIVMGAVILAVWAGSQYRSTPAPSPGAAV